MQVRGHTMWYKQPCLHSWWRRWIWVLGFVLMLRHAPQSSLLLARSIKIMLTVAEVVPTFVAAILFMFWLLRQALSALSALWCVGVVAINDSCDFV